MVDLHTHILPGVDDGAETLEDALEMLTTAYKNGTTDIVLTPHYLTCDMRSFGFSKPRLTAIFNEFKSIVADKLPEINLYLGAETFAAANISDYIERDLLIPIGNSKYVLTEFGFDDTAGRALEITKTIMQAGYTVVVAHPERYPFFLYDPANLLPFLDEGVLLQLNAASILGQNGNYSKEMALSLIDSGLAALVASDCHSVSWRAPDLSEAYSYVSSEYSPEHAEALFCDNPLAVIKNGIIV